MLNKELGNLHLVSIWDESFVIASDLFFGDEIPSGIKIGINREQINDDTGRNVQTLKKELLPLQEWLVKKAVDGIDRGEFPDSFVQRTIDGKIDAKKTYVYGLGDWFESKGITINIGTYHEFHRRLLKSLDDIHYYVEETSLYLALRAYDSDFKVDRGEGLPDFTHLWLENEKLKQENLELKRLSTDKNIPNKHHERHAKKESRY